MWIKWVNLRRDVWQIHTSHRNCVPALCLTPHRLSQFTIYHQCNIYVHTPSVRTNASTVWHCIWWRTNLKNANTEVNIKCRVGKGRQTRNEVEQQPASKHASSSSSSSGGKKKFTTNIITTTTTIGRTHRSVMLSVYVHHTHVSHILERVHTPTKRVQAHAVCVCTFHEIVCALGKAYLHAILQWTFSIFSSCVHWQIRVLYFFAAVSLAVVCWCCSAFILIPVHVTYAAIRSEYLHRAYSCWQHKSETSPHTNRPDRHT